MDKEAQIKAWEFIHRVEKRLGEYSKPIIKKLKKQKHKIKLRTFHISDLMSFKGYRISNKDKSEILKIIEQFDGKLYKEISISEYDYIILNCSSIEQSDIIYGAGKVYCPVCFNFVDKQEGNCRFTHRVVTYKNDMMEYHHYNINYCSKCRDAVEKIMNEEMKLI